MTGQPAAVMFADGVSKGLLPPTSDVAHAALNSLVRNALDADAEFCGRADVDFYQQHGYVRFEKTQKSCTVSLEYAYDDFCISNIAKLLGNASIASQFEKTSTFWRQGWNEKESFFCARWGNGSFSCPKSFTAQVYVDTMFSNQHG
jgi:putative alpha-1,2-mannosidase